MFPKQYSRLQQCNRSIQFSRLLEGIRSAREQGSYILAQSEDSCTIYGMPKAVITNHLPHEILSLDDMGARINQLCGGH